MREIKIWFNKKLAERAVESLRKNNFKACYYDDRMGAISYIEDIIKKNDTIGFGGSITVLHDLMILDVVNMYNKKVFNHNDPNLTAEEKHEVRRKELTVDLFITSSNAITLDGKLVNVDGIGNRVAAMIFGPKKVLIIAGINKIVADLDSALKRIKHITPMNTKRLNLNTPCAETGYCMECNSKDRICNATTILEKKPSNSDIEIVVIGESLGF
ncbi:MAG: lactate utilization protein [Deferribacterota bacterium]|nr:lactate utilization protein [Deferribacterota bacterium]